jgi:hypothetical protein
MTTFYCLYKITNTINGKIYIGVHRTSNLDDGYMGSGKAIQAAIIKYGVEHFHKEILETFYTSEEMYEREKQIVNEEFLLRDDVYNIQRGGHGGFEYLIRSGLIWRGGAKTEEAKLRQAAGLINYFQSDEVRKTHALASSTRLKENNPMKDPLIADKVSKALTGKIKSENHKENISSSMRGLKRPQITCTHCGKSGGNNAMKRYHFDNCKQAGS